MVKTREFMNSIEAYVPGESIEHAKQLYGDIEIIKFASNENPVGVSTKALTAMQEECGKINFYPDTKASKLTQELAEFYGLKSNEIIVTDGSNGSLYSLTEAYLNPGDEVIMCTPTYSEYSLLIKLRQAKLAAVPMDESFTYNLDKMYEKITEKTKLIMICNPNNPTGTMLPQKQIEAFIDKVPSDILVIVDEAYVEFSDVEDKNYSIRFVRKYDNVVVLRTFSKIYGLAGARVGYAMANPAIIDVIYRMQPFAAVDRVALAGASAALADQEFVRKSYEVINGEKSYLYEEFEKLGFDCIPSQTNFIYLNVHTDGNALFENLKPLGIVIRPQHDEIVRISIGTHEQNVKLVAGIKKVLGK